MKQIKILLLRTIAFVALAFVLSLASLPSFSQATSISTTQRHVLSKTPLGFISFAGPIDDLISYIMESLQRPGPAPKPTPPPTPPPGPVPVPGQPGPDN